MRATNGIIEVYCFSSSLGGLIVGGWIDFSWNEPIDPPTVMLRTEDSTVEGEGLICVFPRDDIRKQGLGFILLIEHEKPIQGIILELNIYSSGSSYSITPAENIELYLQDRMFLHAKYFLNSAPANDKRARFKRLLDRAYYNGVDTLSTYVWPIHLEVDKFYFCPPHGLIVHGWFLDPFDRVSRIFLCGSGMRQHLDPKTWIQIKRRDVADAFTSTYGTVEERCGFIAYASSVYHIGEAVFFEIEMKDGNVLFRPAKPLLVTGLFAIKELLGSFELRRDALVNAYGRIVGPAVEAMNTFRLGNHPEVGVIRFGVESSSIRCSVIVPLYGRIDFLEYQLAFFADTLQANHEIIYVLDDPERAAETEALATSAFARFDRPFKLLLLSHNVGFAPANNIGLRHARGRAVCFLNSDVFPRNSDWLESMLATLDADREIGIVGARLLYEDGSLQHDGCTFERLSDFGGWPFPMHPGKGRRVDAAKGLLETEVVTGACMVMLRALAEDLGGFDEGYVIGDFEDADLCLRVEAWGLRCVVDTNAELYHLERQSQNLQASAWRMNLTLYNAWRFQTRWCDREF